MSSLNISIPFNEPSEAFKYIINNEDIENEMDKIYTSTISHDIE